MSKIKTICKILFFSIIALLSSEIVISQKTDIKQKELSQTPVVKQYSFCFKKLQGFHYKKEDQPSAVEEITEDWLLVADDFKQDLLVVSAKDGKVLNSELKFPIANQKWEAMAKDDEGYFYIVGAYNGDLHRFKIDITSNDPTKFEIIDLVHFSLNRNSLLKDSKGISKIEGLAIRQIVKGKKEIVIGLREPFYEKDKIQYAITYKSELPSDNKTSIEPKQFFMFDAGKTNNVEFQISSIEYIPQINGFLIMTSTERPDFVFHGNAIWFISDQEIDKKLPVIVNPIKIGEFESKMKAEGICFISKKDNVTKLAIVFDNDKQLDAELHFYNLTIFP